MQLIKSEFKIKELFETNKEQKLTFYYNSEGTLSVQVWDKKGKSYVDLNFTQQETADLCAFMHHIEIL